MRDDRFTNWRRSSRSSGTGNCVEVGTTDQLVGVRDTKQYGRGPTLEFSQRRWRTFLASVTRGEITR